MQIAKAFEYKKWANNELLEFGERQLAKLSDQDSIFFLRILNHTAVVDNLFISRILGKPEKYSADNTDETPTISQLRKFMAEQDDWLVKFTQATTLEQLGKKIAFKFVDGSVGSMTIEEILLHLLTHGSNHRGMASRVLAENGLERPKDTLTRYLHETEPHRRER